MLTKRQNELFEISKDFKTMALVVAEPLKATLNDYLGQSIERTEYLLNNPKEIPLDTLKDFAKLLNVSPSFLVLYYGVGQTALSYLDAVSIGLAYSEKVA